MTLVEIPVLGQRALKPKNQLDHLNFFHMLRERHYIITLLASLAFG